MRVAVISDTHGQLRPSVLERLAGADLIVHAGDVGDPGILERLREVAPLRAVRGNVDRGVWADPLPETDVVDIGGVLAYVLHDLNALDLSPVAAGFGLVISGHSHTPRLEEREGVVFLNPGACGPRRFRLPVSMAFVEVVGGRVRARLVTLDE